MGTSTKPPSIRGLVRSLISQAKALRAQLLQRLGGGDNQLLAAQASLATDLGREVPADEAADILAQSVACAAPIIAAQPWEWESVAVWFEQQASGWERHVLEVLSTEYAVLSTQDATSRVPCVALHFYEHFLHAWQRSTRKRRGVFFTPQAIADYIVRQVDERLRSELGLPDGLAAMAAQPYREADASRSPFILDPACGTGVFLLAVIDHLHRQLGDRWNDFVPDLLPRLIGIEILPAAAFLAKLNIALKLAQTGYDFRQPGKIKIYCSDALDPNFQFSIFSSQFSIPVFLGNPPFSSLSTNTNSWIAGLVRGDEETRGYIKANGQSLGERKTWLHDDYVKFIRLAQWHIEQAGCGIVAFVTNHGYLDNTTFRLMRSELLRVFPHIQIVDLHGNRKKGETSPSGERDENVFGLDQGVAIGILARSANEGRPRVAYAELWGSREDKLHELQSAADRQNAIPSLALRATMLVPTAPDWRFVPSGSASHPEYDAGWLLTELMPVNSPAPVTARDHFVVAFTEGELRQRIDEFRDLSIPDNEIRQRYFTRTRSARYQQGDTRGWKLSAARRIVAADESWQRHIVRCLYRPFDWRFVFWHPAMIDWPRSEVTRHLGQCGMRRAECGTDTSESSFRIPHSELRSPLCLLARRQQLPTQPCTFFWISDGLALDGVIRSDNRGSESLFPLYLHAGAEQPMGCPNFEAAIVARISEILQLAWLPLGSGDLTSTFGPEDLLGYVYALFHSPNYRQRYAEALRSNFPRVLPPRDLQHFSRWSALGRELIDLHLLRAISPSPALPLSPSIQEFRAGGYVALKKWLQPPHRSATDPQHGQVAAAIAQTIEIMQQMDAVRY